jgi:hypothetical protein
MWVFMTVKIHIASMETVCSSDLHWYAFTRLLNIITQKTSIWIHMFQYVYSLLLLPVKWWVNYEKWSIKGCFPHILKTLPQTSMLWKYKCLFISVSFNIPNLNVPSYINSKAEITKQKQSALSLCCYRFKQKLSSKKVYNFKGLLMKDLTMKGHYPLHHKKIHYCVTFNGKLPTNWYIVFIKHQLLPSKCPQYIQTTT